jgi:hypothetical protein
MEMYYYRGYKYLNNYKILFIFHECCKINYLGILHEYQHKKYLELHISLEILKLRYRVNRGSCMCYELNGTLQVQIGVTLVLF